MTGLPEIDRFNDNATKLLIGGRMWAISYQTVVAYRGPNAPEGVRRDRNYSMTTAKHMGQMGVKDWRKVPDAEFEALASV